MGNIRGQQAPASVGPGNAQALRTYPAGNHPVLLLPLPPHHLLGLPKYIEKTGHYNKRHAFANVTTILIVALTLVIASLRTPNYLLESAASLGAEFLLLVSAILFSLVTRLPYGTINSGIRIYMPYLLLGGFFMLLRMFMAPNIIVDISMPILFTLVSLFSLLTWVRQRHKLPRLDRFSPPYLWYSPSWAASCAGLDSASWPSWC